MISRENPLRSPNNMEMSRITANRMSSQFMAVMGFLEGRAGQSFVGLSVLRCRFEDYFFGKGRRRRLLVPVQCLQIVANELLVEGFLRTARGIACRRPIAGGIRCQHFIAEHDLAIDQAKLELRVGQNDPAFSCVSRSS